MTDAYNSRRSTVHSRNGMVATSQPLASQAGLAALRDGGNAFDAAITATAVLNVVAPMSTGIGGDVFVAYRSSDGDTGAMQACGAAPRNQSRSHVRQAISELTDTDLDEVSMPFRGAQTVTPPGAVKGWHALLERHGNRRLDQALQPAIEYAEDGFVVSEIVADQWDRYSDALFTRPAKETFLVDGAAPSEGQRVRLPGLANSLRSIADHGPDALYDGPLGERIVETVQDRGGVLDMCDLLSVDVQWPQLVGTEYGGCKVLELPPYNAGLVTLEALNIAEELGVPAQRYDSPDRIHNLAEAAKVAFHDGLHYLTDPDFVDVPDLHSESLAARRAERISISSAIDPSDLAPVDVDHSSGSDTVLVCAGDMEGNVVSCISSVFAGFGSGLVAKGTGIVLQNRAAAFSLDEKSQNRLEPRKRPYHGLIPALIRFDRDDWAAFGMMGGYMQPQGHLQLVSNLIDHGMSLQDAVDAPRFRYRRAGTLSVEERMYTGVASGLSRRKHDVRVEHSSSFGGAHVVRWADRTLSGATEPRKDGSVSAF